MLRPGERFARYEIEEVLGQGGMGCVYRARDTRLRRAVALKVLLRRGTDAEWSEAAARLLREAQAVAAFSHASAVQVFDVGQEGDEPFIAMELVAGRTLASFLGAPDVDMRKKIRWLTDIASALGAAHRAGLVHRDVKPDNIVVRADGSLKILDFGLAGLSATPAPLDARSALDATAPRSQWAKLTAADKLLGTPLYMAPEQIRGDSLDGRCDQFAWGVVAYELFEGRTPWPDEGSVSDILDAVLGMPINELPQSSASLPPAVVTTILRALSKNPADRFPSMEHVVSELEPFAMPILLSSRPASLDEAAPGASGSRTRSGKARPRRFGPMVLGFGLAVASALALFFFADRHGTARPEDAGSSTAVTTVPPPSATAVTDLPKPVSDSQEAVVAYVAGMQALRDGDPDGVTKNLQRAVELDSGMAAAYLRLAYTFLTVSQPEARRHFAKARELRSLLSDHDLAVLEALEPLIWGQPPDQNAAKALLTTAALRYPRDAEIALLRALQITDDFRAGVAALDEVLAIDPRFARAHWLRAQRLAYTAELEKALAALDSCLSISRSAGVCAHDRLWIEEQLGQCEREVTDARAMISIDASPRGYEFLANALVATGQPLDTARAALGERLKGRPDVLKTLLQLDDEARLALLTGDFAGAEASARKLEEAAASQSEPHYRIGPARLLVRILEETGRSAEAGRLAERFLREREAWNHDRGVEDFAMASDPTVMMLRAERRAGRVTDSAFQTARDDWAQAWMRRAPQSLWPFLWVHGYADGAESAKEAKEALAALPGFQPQPRFWPFTPAAAFTGRVLLAAGRGADAVVALEAETRMCTLLQHPIETTRASYDLGLAREATNDREGACREYRVVLARWGASRPHSLTATHALDRARALGCQPK